VLLLSVAFLALYGIGVWRAFRDTAGFVAPDQIGLDPTVVTGATVLGLGMFATLFLGTVLAIFLTLGVVRGDAERGLLQPLVVRPVGRATLLLSRFMAAAGVCAVYVAVLFTIETVTTGLIGGWWPDDAAAAGAELAFAVVIVVALSLLGSIFLTATANGIAVFMIFGGSAGGGVGVVLWAVAYLVLVGAVGLAAFARRDLP
jgi:ABC-type transport system involved in multi-copper enzyme maturation permease subunit